MKFWSFEATFLVDIENKNCMYKQIDLDQIDFFVYFLTPMSTKKVASKLLNYAL